MDKRQFLQAALASGSVFLLNSLIPFVAFGAENSKNEDRLLLVLRFNGAWDTLLASDARTKEDLNAANLSDAEFLSFDERASVKSFQHGQLGPAMAPLFNNLDDLCIINGLMMDLHSTIHETNREYMGSGNLIGGTTFFPFALAQELPTKNSRVGYRMEYEPLRDGNYSNKESTVNLASFTSKTADPFEEVLQDENTAASMQKKIIHRNQKEKESILILNQLIAKTETDLIATKTGYKQASMALAGLGSGYLKMAQVDIVSDPDLDTHFNHKSQHVPNLTSGFDQLAKIIKFMKETPYKMDPTLKTSLFDVITVVVTSEFARTSYPEGGDGTSHNQFNNSCILFGANVRGGTLIGDSQIYKKSETTGTTQASLFHASPFDFQTQKALSRKEINAANIDTIGICKSASNCFDYIYPETIWRTLAAQYGVDNLSTLTPGPLLKNIFKS